MGIKLNILVVFSAFVLMTSCNGQTTKQQGNTVENVRGDIVSKLGKSIMVIHQDINNVYWFGSWETGVYKYDGKDLINYSTKHGLPNNRIDEIKEDESGNIYFTSCHPTSTVVKFDGNTFTTLSPTSNNDWQLNSTDIWFKHAYRNEKVYRYNGSNLYELQLPKPPNLSNPFEIYSIYEDRKGNIWFGTNPVGVCRYNGKSFDWITEEDVTEFRNEGANGVRSIAEDKNGDFWFNTENRYSIYDSTTFKSNKFYVRHQSIGGLDRKKESDLDEYLSIVRDNNENLWFVTYLDGIWKYDGTNITHYPVENNSKQIPIFTIYKDNFGDLWLGTHENGAFKFNGTTFEKFVK